MRIYDRKMDNKFKGTSDVHEKGGKGTRIFSLMSLNMVGLLEGHGIAL